MAVLKGERHSRANSMNRRSRILGICGLLLSAGVVFGQAPPSEHSWILTPGDPRCPISSRTSEADLMRIFGRENVRQDDIHVGEGETEPGTLVYASDDTKSLAILWQDPLDRRYPSQIRLRGEKSRWRIARGISLGTRLQEIERLNGKPFRLTGFAWDYGGTVTSWNGGRLEAILAGVILRFDQGATSNLSDRELRSISGDREFSSAHPVVRKLNPRIREVIVGF
jgi:hypothetical protein